MSIITDILIIAASLAFFWDIVLLCLLTLNSKKIYIMKEEFNKYGKIKTKEISISEVVNPLNVIYIFYKLPDPKSNPIFFNLEEVKEGIRDRNAMWRNFLFSLIFILSVVIYLSVFPYGIKIKD